MSDKHKENGSLAQKNKYFHQVLRMHYLEDICINRISKIIPVNATTITRWITKFARENDIIDFRQMNKKDKRMTMASVQQYLDDQAAKNPTPEAYKALQDEVVRLQEELRKAELGRDAYDEMINVAEKRFNIPIRKKAGAKQ